MRVIGTCEGDGLGMASWWGAGAQEDVDMADGEEVAADGDAADAADGSTDVAALIAAAT
jgi:hypothetical protein